MARVDALPEGAKEVLQTGAVIEREFPHELLREVIGLPEPELLSHLSTLKDAELLYERGVYPSSTYVFKHALTREVVYGSVLGKKRRQLHEAIAVALEERYKGQLDEHSAVLAEHFIAGENYRKGAAYAGWAGVEAIKRASINDATAWAEKRISCLDKLPLTEDMKREIIDARTNQALYYGYRGGVPETRDAVRPVVDWALELNYRKRIAQIYTILGTCSGTCDEDFEASFKYLNAALEIARELSDDNSTNFANYWLGVMSSLDCQFEKSEFHFKSALKINENHGNDWGVSLMTSMLSFWFSYYRGRASLAHDTGKDAIRISRASGDVFSKAVAYNCYGFSCYGKGLLKDAIKYSDEALDMLIRLNVIWPKTGANENLAQVYFDLEQYAESEGYYQQAHDNSAAAGLVPSWRNLMEIGVAKAAARARGTAPDWERLKGYDASNKIRLYSGAFRRYIAELLLGDVGGPTNETEYWITRAIETDRANGMMLGVALDYAVYAEWFHCKGERPRARDTLGKALEQFTECGADGWVQRTEEKLAQL
jgi:tetratricopeptide (TPR) repeat protein